MKPYCLGTLRAPHTALQNAEKVRQLQKIMLYYLL